MSIINLKLYILCNGTVKTVFNVFTNQCGAMRAQH